MAEHRLDESRIGAAFEHQGRHRMSRWQDPRLPKKNSVPYSSASPSHKTNTPSSKMVSKTVDTRPDSDRLRSKYVLVLAATSTTTLANDLGSRDSGPAGARSVMLFKIENAEGYVDLETGEILQELPQPDEMRAALRGSFGLAQTGSKTDQYGFLHDAYHQTFTPHQGFLKDIPNWEGKPIPFRGGNIGYHSSSEGKILGMTGTFFERVEHISTPKYTGFSAIYDRATKVVLELGALSPYSRETLERREFHEVEKNTKLWLVSKKRRGYFGLAWEVPMPTAEGVTAQVLIDSTTGDLVNINIPKAMPTQGCTSETNSRVPAPYVSQNQNHVIIQQLFATDVNDPVTYRPFESVWTYGPSDSVPTIQAYSGVLSYCGNHYTLGYVEEVSNNPIYQNWGLIAGSAIGDAIHNTRLTWETLSQYGWEGILGRHEPVSIVVDVDCKTYKTTGIRDNAFYVPIGSKMANEGYAPADSVAICESSDTSVDFPLLTSVSLDIIAHEWGHGILHHHPFINNFADDSMNEGYADIIGYGVEWLQYKPYGWQNWTAGEDFTAVLPTTPGSRQVDTATNGWDDILRFHMDDDTYLTYVDNGLVVPSPHQYGNILPTVFKLMSVGGTNPVCATQPALSHCENGAVEPFSQNETTSVDTAMSIMIGALYNLNQNSSFSNTFSAAMAAADGVGGPIFSLQKNTGGQPVFPTCICYTEEKKIVFDAFLAVGIGNRVCWAQCNESPD